MSSLTTETTLRSLIYQNTTTLLIVLTLTYLYTQYFALGLHRYPGPLLAKFTKLWHLLDYLSNEHQLHLVKLHRQHGEVVRIGPTNLSVSSPEYVSKVYGVSSGFLKSDMYDVFLQRVNGKILVGLLSARKVEDHAALHRPMAKEFAVSVVSEYEPLVDKTLARWIEALDERFCQQAQSSCDMAKWVRFYATEAIMDVTFGESLGFIEKGEDVDSFLQSLDDNIDARGLLLTVPWTAYITKKNPIIGMIKKDNSRFPKWAAKRISARIAARAGGRSSGVKDSKGRDLPDFLDRFLDASLNNTADTPVYDFPLVMNWCLVNIMAGGDTTSIALGSIVYYLLKNPEKQAKLVKELRSSGLSSPMSWRDCQKLKYLDGCIREGIRLHPPVGAGLEVDAGGLCMPDGYVLPQGSRVSMNAWVVARQASVFGDQVDDFVPERWLRRSDEADMIYEDRLNRMKRTDLVFSFGARACTGKPVAFMEIYKAVATLFHTFDIELVDTKQRWKSVKRFLTRVTDIHVTLKRAQQK